MERTNLNKSLKGHSIMSTRQIEGSDFPNTKRTPTNNTNKFSSIVWNSYISQSYYNVEEDQQQQEEDDYANGFTWPPRSYTCSFCKREFKSAQALGGHMNVHRRDRARLRQSPPLHENQVTLLNFDPNPSCNFSSSTPTVLPNSSIATPFLSLSSSPSSACVSEMKKRATCSRVIDTSFNMKVSSHMKKVKNPRLDKKIDINLTNESKEDLDLELRLGY